MKCLIVGAGGVGGSIAAFLALAGNEVTCIVRGAHKENMLAHGLKFHSDLKGEIILPCYQSGQLPSDAAMPYMQVCSTDEYMDTVDVIFVCVKGYSVDSVAPCIRRAALPHTVVVPILNVYGSGPRIARACPGMHVIDGCIYIVGFVNAPGEVTQMGQVFKLIFGARPSDDVPAERLERIRTLLTDAGIKAICSDDINRDTFVKWGFISAMACTGAYFDVPMGEVQHEGPARDVFIGLTRESTLLGEKMGIRFPEDPVTANLRVIDALDPHSTSSLQKDLAKGHESEIQGQLFDMLDACHKWGIEAPTYERVAAKFRQ